jgi:hypothetical protein
MIDHDKRIADLEAKVLELSGRLTDAGVERDQTRFALQAATRLAMLVVNGGDADMQKVWAKAFLELYHL